MVTVCASLVWIGFCSLGERSVPKHVAQRSICLLPASKITPDTFALEDRRSSLHSCIFSIIPKKTQQTDLMFSHNPIFALFSSVAIQREQRKNQEQRNIYKYFSVRSCAESVCAQCACVKMLVWLLVHVPLPTSVMGACVVCAETMLDSIIWSSISSSVRWVVPLECRPSRAQVKTTDPEWCGRGTIAARLQQGWKSLKAGLSPEPLLCEHNTRHRLCLQSKLKETTVVQSHARPRKCLRKAQKAILLAWSNGRDALNLVPGP